ncbi:MFS transporter [Streptomyces olivochromogenes]|uniref:MFS transporter n=1 Tax=Streptomyces olivochromogenes TaxID=1963 RepID=A0A250V5L0_STROL|nr:MFS transporter [Streptomyces olivochromogenes]KUN49299.1 hypothetical protein AQJ27_01900 [Streptomyces olivochromogenes]GAX49336.1 MFS transporter [Streptomyces olivochromogenes]
MHTAPWSGTGDVHSGRTADPHTQGAAEPPGALMTTAAPRPPTHQAARFHKAPVHATLMLAIICVSYFMVILDNSIVFTGLPQIRSDMGFSETGLSWTTNAYVLVFGGPLLIGARAGDLFGHRTVFLFTLIVFSLAATVSTGHAAAAIAARSGAALTGSAVLLALAVLAVLTLIVPSRATRTERFL